VPSQPTRSYGLRHLPEIAVREPIAVITVGPGRHSQFGANCSQFDCKKRLEWNLCLSPSFSSPQALAPEAHQPYGIEMLNLSINDLIVIQFDRVELLQRTVEILVICVVVAVPTGD